MKLKQLTKLTEVEFKLFLREPTAFFFTLIFPIILLVVFGSAFGNQPLPNNLKVIDYQIPGLIAMVIASVGLMGISIVMAEYRETGIFKRLKTTPLSPSFILISQVIVNFIVISISSLLLLGVASLIFKIKFLVNILNFLIAFSLSFITFFSLGFMLSGLFRTARSVQAAGMILFFPMLFLSGAAMPIENIPNKILQKLAEINPLTYVVDILTETWLGGNLNEHLTPFIILIIITILFIFISIKTFRWE